MSQSGGVKTYAEIAAFILRGLPRAGHYLNVAIVAFFTCTSTAVTRHSNFSLVPFVNHPEDKAHMYKV